MITITELDEFLQGYGRDNEIPVSFNAFKGRPDADVMIMWANPSDSDFYAEDTNFKRIASIQISLLQSFRDLSLEQGFESALSQKGVTFALIGSEYYSDEDLWETTYQTEVFK